MCIYVVLDSTTTSSPALVRVFNEKKMSTKTKLREARAEKTQRGGNVHHCLLAVSQLSRLLGSSTRMGLAIQETRRHVVDFLLGTVGAKTTSFISSNNIDDEPVVDRIELSEVVVFVVVKTRRKAKAHIQVKRNDVSVRLNSCTQQRFRLMATAGCSRYVRLRR